METGGAEIELRPLTLFYGYNNAGKSALLRGICHVVEALAKPGENLPLPLRSPIARGGDFDSFVSFEKGSFVIEAWDHDGKRFGWELRDMPEFHRHIVDVFFCELSNDELEFRAIAKPDSKTLYHEAPLTYDVESGTTRTDFPGIIFDGLRPSARNIPLNLSPPSLFSSFDSLKSEVPIWLSSNRTFTSRQHERRAGAVVVEPDGSGVEQLLIRAKEKSAPWFEKMQEWFRKNLAIEIYVEPTGKNFSITVGRTGDPFRSNLMDCGQGIQELLPIVSVLFARQDGDVSSPLLALEEPESHLHPKFHPLLGDLFAEMAEANSIDVILAETHSESLLLNVQLMIAKGKLSRDNVIVYWIRQSEKGFSVAEPVEFEKDGSPGKKWPPRVFSTDIELARELFKRQRELEKHT